MRNKVIVLVLGAYLFGVGTAILGHAVDGHETAPVTPGEPPDVDVSWGSGQADEDDLVVTVDGVERWREHGDNLGK
jgi:hypothetical protein